MSKRMPFHLFPAGADRTRYRSRGLTILAAEAFSDLGFFLRPAFLSRIRTILDDPRASDRE